jgi:phosphoserine phosphatase
MTRPLKTWRETPTRQKILDYVSGVTEANSPNFVPPSERIAVFDNDGTLWCEKPMYIQLDYILRKLKAQAEEDPQLRGKQPWKAAWEQDLGWLGGTVTKHYQGDDSDMQVLLGGILKLSAGMPVEQVETEASQFIHNEEHPTLGLLYRDCVYKPMLELLEYLEANDFTNYIVSGGGRDFMRGFAQDLYGIPRERLIGTTVAYHYKEDETVGKIVHKGELDVIDDGPAKAIQIWNVIGRRPILAAGNSNGDIQMLKFTAGQDFESLCMLILHDDAEREFDYSAGAEKAISEQQSRNWTAVSMRSDWHQVFPV